MHLTIYPNELALIEEEANVRIGGALRESTLSLIPDLIDPFSFRCQPLLPGLRMIEFVLEPGSRSEDEDGLPETSSMRMTFESMAEGEWPCRFSYLTGGVSWSASYTIIIRGDVVDISLYASITNRSGTILPRADLHLVSKYDVGGMFVSYDVAKTVDLPDGVMKHIELFSLADVPLRNRYLAPYDSEEILVTRYFRNDEEGGLGYEIPPGDVRVYESVDRNAHLSYIDAFRFPPIPMGSIIDLSSKKCDDIEMEGEWDRYGTATMRIVNRLEEDVILEIEERCPEDDLILSNSHDFVRRSDEMIGFIVEASVLEPTIVNYTIDPSLIDSDWDRRSGWSVEAEMMRRLEEEEMQKER